ncbi:HAD hydrolase-like protein [Marinilongibacter aquaticus]|uniref:KdsC family phosphatase n=1 Tax=Marinilongibacter aquaticus TaxID=2975157 RepID=UPI0021BDECAA|nr:HAD hydrolase-like protein [Marinilongibacter aquaticus]UBM60539.1 HAD hydrolase-like protein [Marinilongibacter aquaticus]
MKFKTKSRLNKISTLVFDVDGVFTDATILVTEDGSFRSFSMRDGYAVRMAANAGYKLAVISGGKEESIRTRMRAIGIEEVHLSVGTAQKAEIMNEILTKWKLQEEEVLYMGDDIPDLLLMNAFAVFKVCPADAQPEVKEVAEYIAQMNGGNGAVREVVELVMKAQNKWMKQF